MPSVYFDPDDAYIAAGAGTLLSPFNRSQYEAALAASSATDYFFVPHAGASPVTALFDVTYDMVAGGAGNTVQAYDEAFPWLFIIDGSGDPGGNVWFSTSQNGSFAVAIKDMAIKVFNAGLATIFVGMNSMDAPIAKNCSFFASELAYAGNFGVNIWSAAAAIVSGCSFQTVNCNQRLLGAMGSVAQDSIFLFDPAFLVMGNRSGLTANNCVHNATPGALAGTENTVQDSWGPATSMPNASSVKSDFLYSTVAPVGGASEITIPASGSFAGYEKGFFGGIDRTIAAGIGALWFGPFSGFPAALGGLSPLGTGKPARYGLGSR